MVLFLYGILMAMGKNEKNATCRHRCHDKLTNEFMQPVSRVGYCRRAVGLLIKQIRTGDRRNGMGVGEDTTMLRALDTSLTRFIGGATTNHVPTY